MSHNPKIKVLISAYACEPNKGSEPGVGWNWAKQIARFAEVHVITRANNRNVIEEELKKSPVSNLFFHYYDVPKWLSFWKKKTRGMYLYYLLWQIGAFKLAEKLKKEIKFDLVHHLTFGNIWLPTFMPFLGVPFIWGPVGGGEQVPYNFRRDFSFKSKIQETLRDLMIFSIKLNPFLLLTCIKASSIIGKTEETLLKIPRLYCNNVIKMIETGIQIKDFNVGSGTPLKKDVIQIISVGRLISLKGFDLALKAFLKASKERSDIRLVIVGDGQEKSRLMKICEEHKQSSVIFTGQLDRKEVLELMASSSIFLFPSLKEGGAWVLYEAMSLGLPIICLDIAGPRDIVTETCGIKIKPINPEQTINDLADAILKLANDPELRKRMGEAGRMRVMEHYTWDKKGEFIKEVYEKVLGKKL